MTRRHFSAALAMAGAPAGERVKLAVFSKHLQWAGWDEMAESAAACGFGGVDLTVRKGGHVLPERVAEDLPKACAAVRKAGLEVPMITTDIADTASPHAEAVLQAAASLGIRRYRWGGLTYDDSKPIPAQFEALLPRIDALAKLNRRLGLTAMYHTHSGMQIGAPIWDLWELLRRFNPAEVAINYDLAHATVEGGFGGWIRSAQLVMPMMAGIALKDFLWSKNAKGAWAVEWRRPGEGMVQFTRFLKMLTPAARVFQVHFEYAGLGGAEHGNAKLTIPKQDVLAQFRSDVAFYTARLRESGFTV